MKKKSSLKHIFFSFSLCHGNVIDNFFFFLQRAFINLHQTLSKAVHNCSLWYEKDVLPIPDLSENIFSKSDALALGRSNHFLLHVFFFFCNLAAFYSIPLPNMPYEIVSNVANLPSNSLYWLNSFDLKDARISPPPRLLQQIKKSFKRKLIENEGD